jgi:DNA-binding XRE family transcriptional regulator
MLLHLQYNKFMDMKIIIKEELRALRDSKGVSRETLSKVANVTMQTIYRAETTGKINLVNYVKIINALENYTYDTSTVDRGSHVNYI